jgi:spermidine synthase
MVVLSTWDASTSVEVTTVARATSPRGEVVLRRRATDGALELRVNGVFVMDSAETTTERAIARLALDRLDAPPSRLGHRVLVGGLGLGYTIAELLEDRDVATVVVAEIEPALIDWHRAGLVPGSVIASPRVRVDARDVRDVVRAQSPGSLDAVILDVDNGPGYLVYDNNAGVYEKRFLARCRTALSAGGILVVWSADRAPALQATLGDAFARVEHAELPVGLGRIDRYHAYIASGSPRKATQ